MRKDIIKIQRHQMYYRLLIKTYEFGTRRTHRPLGQQINNIFFKIV